MASLGFALTAHANGAKQQICDVPKSHQARNGIQMEMVSEPLNLFDIAPKRTARPARSQFAANYSR